MDPHSQYCSWLITTAKTFVVSMKFSKLNIPQCNDTFLNIYNGPNDTSPLLGKYCGENATAGMEIRSSTNHLFIVGNSGSYGSHPKSLFAFQAYYKAQLLGCTRTYTAQSGSISSHDITQNETDLNFQYCSWLIIVEKAFVISLKFSILHIPQCNDAFLSIYNGPNDAPLLGKYCGENASAGMEISSSTNYLLIVGNYGGNGSYPRNVFRFQAHYIAHYLSKENEWPTGNFGLPKAITGCPGDAKSGWREGWRFQDMEDEELRSIASPENHMAVTFPIRNERFDINRTFCMLNQMNKETRPWPKDKSDSSGRTKLYYCYYVDCRDLVSGPNGSISSHNIAQNDVGPHSQYCSWLITVAETFVISLKFSILNIPQCNDTYLNIYNGPNDTSPLLGKYCGENATAGMEIRTLTSHLFIVGNSGSYGSNPKIVFAFRGQYSAQRFFEDCHHDVIVNSGTIKSPVDSPVGYPRRSNCSWLITVDLDDIIILNINTLNIGNDVLTIYDGMNSSAHVLGRFFRHSNNIDNNTTLLSSTNNIYILLQYEKFSNLKESGFVLEYKNQQVPTEPLPSPKSSSDESTIVGVIAGVSVVVVFVIIIVVVVCFRKSKQKKENHLPQIQLKNKVQDDDGNHIYEAPPDLIGNTPNGTPDSSEQKRYRTINKVNVPLPELPSQNEDNEGKSDKLDYVAVIEPHYQPLIHQKKHVPPENYDKHTLQSSRFKKSNDGFNLQEKSTTTE
ncbi:cubilin-like [Xenia sp. Carnegie-2017]|uniref:cubilin-like n=1 Tax=Xenia sp. Carnegie-2017 TaxID=2897299 RepID=UPI001F0415A1|nr:cubilin-like [Xenia sp. Carnegie-2017]